MDEKQAAIAMAAALLQQNKITNPYELAHEAVRLAKLVFDEVERNGWCYRV